MVDATFAAFEQENCSVGFTKAVDGFCYRITEAMFWVTTNWIRKFKKGSADMARLVHSE